MRLKSVVVLTLLAILGLAPAAAAQTVIERFEKVEITSAAADALTVAGSTIVGATSIDTDVTDHTGTTVVANVLGVGHAVVRNGANVNGPIAYFFKSRAASGSAASTIVASGDKLLNIEAYGADAMNYVRGAAIRAEVDGTPGTNDMPTRLVFLTTANGANEVTERLRIDNAGNVGIGTSSPGADLDIVNTANDPDIHIGESATTFASIFWDRANDLLGFHEQVSGSGGTRLVIKSGNVGIGTTNPSAMLSVGASSQFQVSSTGAISTTSAGPHAIGGTTVAASAFSFRGDFPGTSKVDLDGVLTVTAGETGAIVQFGGALTEAGSGTHPLLAKLRLTTPTVNAGAAAVTDTAVLYIQGAMSATVTGENYAIWSDAGKNRFDGQMALGGATADRASQVIITGTLSPLDNAFGLYVDATFNIPVNGDASAMSLSPTFVEAASGTHALITGHRISGIGVTAGGATITNTAVLYISGPMTPVVTGVNYVFWIAAGTTVRWGGYGAGTATFDASGNITSVSDARFKTNVRNYGYGLDAVRQLRPVVFNWNEASRLDREHDYAGFIAQEVEAILGDSSVGRDENGYLTLQERAIVAATVKAIQELAERVDRLER